MKNLAFLSVALLGLVALAGCNSEPTPAPPPATTTQTAPAAPAVGGTGGAAKAAPSAFSSNVEAAPAGANTTLSGGLNGSRPQ